MKRLIVISICFILVFFIFTLGNYWKQTPPIIAEFRLHHTEFSKAADEVLKLDDAHYPKRLSEIASHYRLLEFHVIDVIRNGQFVIFRQNGDSLMPYDDFLLYTSTESSISLITHLKYFTDVAEKSDISGNQIDHNWYYVRVMN